jgi:hypothetical protein
VSVLQHERTHRLMQPAPYRTSTTSSRHRTPQLSRQPVVLTQRSLLESAVGRAVARHACNICNACR